MSSKMGKWPISQGTRTFREGFREGTGCRDNLFILRQSVDDIVAAGESTVCVYVDYRAAFDSLIHD